MSCFVSFEKGRKILAPAGNGKLNLVILSFYLCREGIMNKKILYQISHPPFLVLVNQNVQLFLPIEMEQIRPGIKPKVPFYQWTSNFQNQ